MATVIYQAPAGKSIGLGVLTAGTWCRIRPFELFGLDTANSTQTDAALAAGFDYTQHTAFVAEPASVLDTQPTKRRAFNPYLLVADP